MSLVVTVALYRKLVIVIEDTKNKPSDVYRQEANNLSRL
jgi:hypothetical protein